MKTLEKTADANATERAFYAWLSRVEEAGHASREYIRGAADSFEGFDRGERSVRYVRGLRAGERFRREVERKSA